ncbi:MAG TPA: cellulase family glycosylhydrolase [Pirellulaceae bacterium]|nr:cellulase family glycosylhydrolase [Pirellulaceae bacterium]
MTTHCNTRGLLPAIALILAANLRAAELPWIKVSGDQKSFVTEPGGQPFVPWGFNYDHDETKAARLIEDYWEGEWPKVEADFREMKELGANVVRIHLQFGKFMEAADKPSERSLAQLARLVKLAEATGLYLDLTGLACYHKKDVPAWYDALEEGERWAAQAAFWKAVAATCKDSPAIFCYDLMNEPVVPGRVGRAADWLGPPLGDKHFVQYITREAKGRERHDIARQWIEVLVKAIRAVDRRHLITVGLVPWSLDKPGLTSGFVPDKIAGELDFVAVHVYPEAGKLDEALETLAGFNIGKPVVVEEMFCLKCSADELGRFIDQSREKKTAAGWIGFYWGRTPEELRGGATLAEAFTLSWLELFQKKRAELFTK